MGAQAASPGMYNAPIDHGGTGRAMKVIVNGDEHELPEGLSVAELVERIDLAGERIALEVNREVVPRSEYTSTTLADGDRVEIVRAIGGG